jgi:hypothetical protein
MSVLRYAKRLYVEASASEPPPLAGGRALALPYTIWAARRRVALALLLL